MSIKPKQAMILAAGEGKRMQPLTLTTPKPLLKVAGKPLIVWHIERLLAMGIDHIVINVRYLADKMAAFFEQHHFAANITLSFENEFEQPIETAAGIQVALQCGLLKDEPFLLINGDVWTNMPLSNLGLPKDTLAYLVLVDNPTHNPSGDFLLSNQADIDTDMGQVLPNDSVQMGEILTFAGISVLSPRLFDGLDFGEPCRLAPVLQSAMAGGQVMGKKMDKHWHWVDVGTPARLDELNDKLKSSS